MVGLIATMALVAAIAIAAAPGAGAQPDVVINEVVAANDHTLTDSFGDTPDWIELYNPTAAAVSLAGFTISDDGTSWPVPAGVEIAAGGYLIVHGSGRSVVTEAGEVHTSFSLSRRGETITLVGANGAQIDQVTYPELGDDVAFGRGPDGTSGELVQATPGAANSALMPGPVTLGLESGTFTGSVIVGLAATTGPGEAIYYRTDGEDPDQGSTLYDGPITIDTTTTLSAAVIDTATGTPGPTVHATYTKLASNMAGYSSSLPMLVIDPEQALRRTSVPYDQSQPWITSTITMFDVGADGRSRLAGAATDSGWAEAKIRGHTSSLSARPGFGFEWQSDSTGDQNQHRPMFGLAADDDWVLVAAGGVQDAGMVNDPFAYELGDRLGVLSMDYRLVELIIDNDRDGLIETSDRYGLYMLVEKIENGSHRVDVSEAGIRLSLDKPDDCCAPIDLTPDIFGHTGMHIIQLEDPNVDRATEADIAWVKAWYDDAEASFTRP